jgi:hypothetical protein
MHLKRDPRMGVLHESQMAPRWLEERSMLTWAEAEGEAALGKKKGKAWAKLNGH